MRIMLPSSAECLPIFSARSEELETGCKETGHIPQVRQNDFRDFFGQTGAENMKMKTAGGPHPDLFRQQRKNDALILMQQGVPVGMAADDQNFYAAMLFDHVIHPQFPQPVHITGGVQGLFDTRLKILPQHSFRQSEFQLRADFNGPVEQILKIPGSR